MQTHLPARTPLPTALQPIPALDIHSRYHSARTGGDFFDATLIGQHLIFFLTDIAGTRNDAHTIAAALQDTLYLQSPQLFGSPAANLTDAISTLAHAINQTLIDASRGVRFAPTFLACYDLALGILTFINAGGQPAIFSDSDGTRLLGNISMPLGLFTLLTFEPGIQAFEPGARLLLVTKGIPECRRGSTHFDLTRIIETTPAPDSALALCEAVVEQAHKFRKLPWYSPQNLPFFKPRRIEDLTAAVLIRPPTKP
jgi:serine phosphatase RsbU (regulator of sigma subunit)